MAVGNYIKPSPASGKIWRCARATDQKEAAGDAVKSGKDRAVVQFGFLCVLRDSFARSAVKSFERADKKDRKIAEKGGVQSETTLCCCRYFSAASSRSSRPFTSAFSPSGRCLPKRAKCSLISGTSASQPSTSTLSSSST
jgi:hypothetical protein